jgi:hypothetical protein
MVASASISVILTAWNRPQYLEEQVQAVLSQTVEPLEIVLWYNQPSRRLGLLQPKPLLNFNHAAKVKKIVCDHNFGIIPRFLIAGALQGEYVCIFDDDTIPGRGWFENCLRYADSERCLLGTIGLRLLSAEDFPVRTQKPRMGWEGCNAALEFVDFVGHSWFFKRRWIRHFLMEEPPLSNFGEDIHFCAMLQKNGIRAACPPHPAADRSLWGSLYPERGLDRVAISARNRDRDYHTVVRHEITQGFKPLLL